MSFQTLGDMASRTRDPPPYQTDKPGTLAPHWWNVQQWSLKKWLLLGAGVAVAIIVIVVAVVESDKNNKYPSYSKLDYSLVDHFTTDTFFDNFDYYTDADPTDGFVIFVDSTEAATLNLTYAGASSAFLRVDNSSSTTTSSSSSQSSSANNGQGSSGQNGQSGQSGGQSSQQGGMLMPRDDGLMPRADATDGRYSVRVTSQKQWDTGLFIFDVIHTPYGCATWPALWLSDVPNWPTNGEIDVMESVNNATSGNQMTLHTTDDCKMNVKRKETGTVSGSNCWNGTDDNAGCGVKGKPASFGKTFNDNGGGVMAMELRDAGIRMWQFARDSIPDDISDQSPDPSGWGEALADFPNTHCDIGSHFKNQSIIIDITLCGDWAGATSVYTDEDSCPSTCTAYAAQNATAFDTAYWEFGNFSIYQAS